MKTCTHCKTEKHLSEFSPDRRIASGVQSRCKVCYAEIMKARRLQDPDSHRLAVKLSTQKHYADKLERNNKYRQNNPLKVKEWKKTDRKNNKIRILSDNAKRRAKLVGEISPEIMMTYALRDFFQAMSLGEMFHVDHIIPLSRGGLHIADNLQVIPAIDNLRKGANL